MEGIESGIREAGARYEPAAGPLPGINLTEGERYLKELRNHSGMAAASSEEILQNTYEFDELMRKEHISGLSENGLFKAIRLIYMRVANKGADYIIDEGVKEFDQVIKDHEEVRERLEWQIDEAYRGIENTHRKMAETAERIKKAENGVLYINNKQSELEKLVFSKREGADTRGKVKFSYLSEDYHDMPLYELTLEAGELKRLAGRAKSRVNPLYSEVKSLDVEYRQKEGNARLLEALAAQRSEDISVLYENKAKVNVELMKLMREQMRIAKLTEESGKRVNRGLAMSRVAMEYLSRNYNSVFSSMALRVEADGRWDDAQKRADEQIDSFCENSQIGGEESKTAAMAILNERGII